MFTGILIGLMVIFSKSQEESRPILDTFQEFLPSKPDISIQKQGRSLKEFAIVWKAQRRIYKLMNKDSLTKQDSAEIKAIDQQLNKMLHD